MPSQGRQLPCSCRNLSHGLQTNSIEQAVPHMPAPAHPCRLHCPSPRHNLQAFFAPLPVNCSGYPSNGRPAYVFRWYTGAGLPAGAKLAITSCGLVSGSIAPTVSVRGSSYANAGPYTCLG